MKKTFFAVTHFGVLVAPMLLGAGCSSGEDRPHAAPTNAVASAGQALGAAPDTNCVLQTRYGADYWFCSNHRSYADSRAKCQTIGFDLVRIDDVGENDFIRSNISSDTWLGAADSAVEGAWLWAIGGNQFWSGTASGSAVGGLYTNWSSGQPNNLGNEDCAQALTSGKWDDRPCGDLEGFVCESAADLCPSDPKKTQLGACGCGVADTDSDGDGTADCNDQCPADAARIFPGDCGCANAPKPAGTTCSDGLCSANTQCNGAGTCGDPNVCPKPDSTCTFQFSASTYYWVCDNDRPFANARQRCASVGMDLATIESKVEDDFLKSKIHEHSFIAASDQTTEGEWIWLPTNERFWTGGKTGSRVGTAYVNWEAGQPDDSLASEDCAMKDAVGAGRWETQSCTASEAFICERRHRFVTTEVTSTPSSTFGSPFGEGMFAPDGSLLVATRTNMIRVPVGGTGTKLLPTDEHRRFRIDRASGRWGYYDADQFRLYHADGTFVRSYAMTVPGMALFVPGTDKLALVLTSGDSHDADYDRVQIADEQGNATEFSVAGVQVAQAAPTRLFYSTVSELIAKDLSGNVVWQMPVPLRDFRVSDNGTRVLGVRAARGSTIVNIDAANGTVTEETALSSPMWALGISPSGEYGFAATDRRISVFNRGRFAREVALPTTFFTHADINDSGELVVGIGGTGPATTLLFLGASGTDAASVVGIADDHAYRPFTAFKPGGRDFFAVRKEGLTTFTVSRRL